MVSDPAHGVLEGPYLVSFIFECSVPLMLYESQVRKAYHCGLDPSSVSQLPVSVQKDQGSKAAIAGEIIYISLSLCISARSLV